MKQNPAAVDYHPWYHLPYTSDLNLYVTVLTHGWWIRSGEVRVNFHLVCDCSRLF